jgi:hypothetical protein
MAIHGLRRFLPLIAILLGFGGAYAIAGGAPLASAQCGDGGDAVIAADEGGSTSSSGCQTGNGSVTLGSIANGDFSQVTVSGPGNTPLVVQRNESFDDFPGCSGGFAPNDDYYYFAETDNNGLPINNDVPLDVKYTAAVANPSGINLNALDFCYAQANVTFAVDPGTPALQSVTQDNPITFTPETLYYGLLPERADCGTGCSGPFISKVTAGRTVVNVFIHIPSGNGDPHIGS